MPALRPADGRSEVAQPLRVGHLGLHGLADNHFDGDLKKAQKRLQQNGLARQDPAPWNGAWPKYRPVTGHEVPRSGEQGD